jgi:hypothetical protein
MVPALGRAISASLFAAGMIAADRVFARRLFGLRFNADAVEYGRVEIHFRPL